MALKPSTLRLIPRWNENGVGPLIGLATFPLPEGAREGDLIEVILGPDGKATWSVLTHEVLGTEYGSSTSVWLNAYTYDHLFACGYILRACLTPIEEGVDETRPKQYMCALRLPQVEARFDALWPLFDAEPFDRLAVNAEIEAIGQWIGDEGDPDLVRARAMVVMFTPAAPMYDEEGMPWP